jgi:hypothetical protein
MRAHLRVPASWAVLATLDKGDKALVELFARGRHLSASINGSTAPHGSRRSMLSPNHPSVTAERNAPVPVHAERVDSVLVRQGSGDSRL